MPSEKPTTTAQATTEAAPAPAATNESGEAKTETAAPAATASAAPEQSTTEKPKAVEGAPDAAPEADKANTEAATASELKLPEGVEVNEAFLTAMKETWKGAGLTTEQQQATLDSYVKFVAEQDKAFEQQQQQQRLAWREQIKSDPELGGARFDASVSTVAKAVDRFFGPEFRKLLDATGLGDHPEAFRGLHQIGLRISEDTIAGTTSDRAPKVDPLRASYDHPDSRRLK